MVQCLWSAPVNGQFRPVVRDVLGHYTHPFPSRDGNRRSFVQVTDVRRIPQNSVAPFRMESRTLVEIDWSEVNSNALVGFIGKIFNFWDEYLL